MKILVAPSAFKGTLDPLRAAHLVAAGLQKSFPQAQLVLMPIADGGDGTIAVLQQNLGGSLHHIKACGPTGQPVIAHWLALKDLAIIELANACGLGLLDNKNLSPLTAHTFGLGQVIFDCFNAGHSKILIALGGSASTDGGTGALAALCARFLDGNANPLPLGGGCLTQLEKVDLSALHSRIKNTSIELAIDVRSPLLGENGAAYLFAPQKGASSKDVIQLEDGLRHLADLLAAVTGNDLRNEPGTGVAGGTAFGLASILKAKLTPGFAKIAQLLQLVDHLPSYDLIVTAEGRIDRSSFLGKATGELAKMCQSANRPLWVITASIDPQCHWQDTGVSRIFSLGQDDRLLNEHELVEAMQNAIANDLASFT